MNINKNLSTPLYMQIYNHIADEIKNGYLLAGERLPSRRALCRELDVAPRTVENAYNKLIISGYVVSRPGSGFYVSDELPSNETPQLNKKIKFNFSSNGVETSKLPFDEWARLMRRTIREDTGLFQHGEKAGEKLLLRSIRRMLFRSEGIRCKTEQIIIGPGAEDLMREVFLLFGRDYPILMNNYYNYRVKAVAAAIDATTQFITNGHEGIDISELEKYNCGLLYQKPTHDLPTSVTLSEEKRKSLVEWASGNRYIIEDSDENDYCYRKRSKTLWELSGGKNVIYLGSFSKTIAPSMKIGYVLLPEELVPLWHMRKKYYSNRVSRVEQITLSRFIDLGHYERHVGYMRSIYRAKAEALSKAIFTSPLGNIAEISGSDCGMFCLIKFNIDADESYTSALLNANGIKASTLSSSIGNIDFATYPPNTYILGYGDLKISQIYDGIKIWANAWSEFC